MPFVLYCFLILVYSVVSSSTYTTLFLFLYRKTAFEQNIFSGHIVEDFCFLYLLCEIFERLLLIDKASSEF